MMRKLLFAAFLMLAMQGISFGQSTQPSFNNLYAFDSCSGSSGIYPIMAEADVSNPSSGLTVDFYWGDGNSTLNVTSNNGNYFVQAHNYLLPGTYTVAVVLMNGTMPLDTMMQSVNSLCSQIWGNSYKRNDNNCSLDITDDYLYSTYSIQVKENGIPIDTFQASAGIGYHIDNANANSVYSLNVITPPTGLVLACPAIPYEFKLDTLNYGPNPDRFNFAFDCDPNYTAFDLKVAAWGHFSTTDSARMGITALNTACADQAATVTLNLSPKYSFVSSYPSPTSTSGNTISWDFNVSQTNSQYIILTLNPVGILSLGDTVMNTVTITPKTGDVDTANNTLLMIDTIKSSWDPNNKSVEPNGNILPGTALTYTVNFENMGNDTALNIHILDTLSSNLNVKTLKVVASSAAVSFQIFNTTAGNVLKFNFANINLPDTSSAPNNKGYIIYQVEAKSDLQPGATIENSAAIYFDVNPAVITNSTWNMVPTPEGISERILQHQIKIYPNPAEDKLYIKNLGIFNVITISNALGQIMVSQKLEKGITEISVKDLANGVYFLQAFGKHGNYTQKFIKK